MRRTRILAWTANVDIDRLAAGLCLTRDEVDIMFRNMRFATWLAEAWAWKFLPDMGHNRIVFRSMSVSPVRFQESCRVGAKRSCTHAQLISDVSGLDWFVVSDFRHFPQIDWYLIPARTIETHVKRGVIKVEGVSPDTFDFWIATYFEVLNSVIAL